MEAVKAELTLFFLEETRSLIINLKTSINIKMGTKAEDIQFC
jgi:hypothetical protein